MSAGVAVGEGLVFTLVSEAGVFADGTGSDVAEGTVLVGLGDGAGMGVGADAGDVVGAAQAPSKITPIARIDNIFLILV